MDSTFFRHFLHRFLFVACYCLLAVLPAAETAGQQPGAPPLTAEEILQRMAKRYANCKSYRDSGILNTVDIKSTGRKVKERRFTTAFSRPDRFRFEYQYVQPRYGLYRYIIWAHGDDVRTYWDATPPAQQQPSLQLAVAGAVGVTELAAYFIPSLLMAQRLDVDPLVEKLDKEECLEDAKLGDHDCFRIGGRFSESPTTLCIDKATFLLRRIDKNDDFDTFRTETTITCSPMMDVELDAKELEFDPPTTRSVPSVAELLGDEEGPPAAPGWLEKIGSAWLTALIIIGAIMLVLIVLAVRRRGHAE